MVIRRGKTPPYKTNQSPRRNPFPRAICSKPESPSGEDSYTDSRMERLLIVYPGDLIMDIATQMI